MTIALTIQDSDVRARECNKLRDECVKKIFKSYKVTKYITINVAVIQTILSISRIFVEHELSVSSLCCGVFSIVALIICYISYRSASNNATLIALS